MPIFIKHKLSNLINITKVATIFSREHAPGYTYGGESHDFWELVYVESGQMCAKADEKEIIVNAGEIIFHKPNEYHDVSVLGRIPANLIIITFTTSSAAMNFFFHKKIAVPSEILPLLFDIIRESRDAFCYLKSQEPIVQLIPLPSAPIGAEQLIKIHLEQLLICLIRNETSHSNPFYTSKSGFEAKIVSSIKQELTERVNGVISIHELCCITNYSKSYISAIFKASTGMSIITYFNTLKINKAKELIMQNTYTISEISAMLSFGTHQYFTKIFKSVVGMSPQQYARHKR